MWDDSGDSFLSKPLDGMGNKYPVSEDTPTFSPYEACHGYRFGEPQRENVFRDFTCR
jgi:hypothetical protein